jgi:outer membrane autotransporter protein
MAGSLAFLSSDLISTGLFQAMDATEKIPSSWVGFAAINGGYHRYQTGSHTDVTGGHLLVGLGKRTPTEAGSFLVGLFAETGLGQYKGENDVASGTMDSKGDLRYYGGGLLARVDINQVYVHAAVRLGSTHMGYQSNDIYPPEETNYDTNTLYYGAQLGIGYDAKISDCSGIELYARYAWVHQKGKDVTALGHRVSLEDANSHRVKAGARFYNALTNTVTPYIGAGYEHEFDGRLKGTLNNMDITNLSLEGGSGFAELGLRIDTISKNLLLDFNVTGYAGERTGINGTLKLKYLF